MAKCNFKCDAVATTTLMKNSGEVVQLCEKHRDLMIRLFRKIAAGEVEFDRDDASMEANHWFVLNKIPV